MHSNPNPPTEKEHHELVEALVDVGAAWARYGLGVGRAALETSARTLSVTASALDALARTFEQRREEPSDARSVVEAPAAK
ncbi:MAG: hypothetical protein OZ921_13580 [Sorangiineae bacterium]|nr:hypothetical protein [Polyangiaceae bacterium]MEB2323537.1 hypothetical protein [Sorangiineae bacterium]